MFAGALLERPAFGATSVAGTLTPYADPMPTLVDNLIDTRGVGSTVNLSTYLITRKLHRDLPPTALFGYLQSNGPGADDTAASYLGPVIFAKSAVPVSASSRKNASGSRILNGETHVL